MIRLGRGPGGQVKGGGGGGTEVASRATLLLVTQTRPLRNGSTTTVQRREGPCECCELATGILPAAAVFEDDCSYAFPDRRPLSPGHFLLVTRRHVATQGELPPELGKPLFRRAQLRFRAVQEVFGAEGTFSAINNRVHQSVPHLRVHVFPGRRRVGPMGFFWSRDPCRGVEKSSANPADRA